MVASRGQCANHTKALRFNQSPHAVFRLSTTTLLSESQERRSDVRVRIVGHYFTNSISPGRQVLSNHGSVGL